jgi:hypothetical protein
VIGGKTLGFRNLQDLIRECQILNDCPLLLDLGVVKKSGKPDRENENWNELMKAKEFLLNLIKTQHIMGKQALIQNVRNQFIKVSEPQIEGLIQQLCKEKQIQILDPNAKPEAQLICLVPER